MDRLEPAQLGAPMIWEREIREALSPDPLAVAKSRVQTRKIAAVIRERREAVLSALRASRSVPTEGQTGGCSGSGAAL